MSNPTTPRPCPVPWCRQPHAAGGQRVHLADLDTITANATTIGLALAQAENEGVFGPPVIRVIMHAGDRQRLMVDVPAVPADALGAIIDGLTVPSVFEFGAALTRGSAILQGRTLPPARRASSLDADEELELLVDSARRPLGEVYTMLTDLASRLDELQAAIHQRRTAQDGDASADGAR